MRSAKLRNRKKKCVRGRNKRTRRRRSNEIVWAVKNEVSILSLDNMNDVIRTVKTQRVKGKRWWKVMPKDSYEVYKSRKRRYTYEDRRKQDEIDTTDESVIQEDESKHDGKSRNKQQNRKKSDKEVRFRRVKKRSSEYSTASSTTMSTESTKSTSSSYLYEMDYE